MHARHSQIDSLRGVACIALVVFHTIGPDKMSGLRVADDHGLRLLSDLLSYLRMPLFAFLSGYVYAFRPVERGLPEFIAAKARRLLVPMLAVGTLFAILQSHTPGTNFSRYEWHLLHIKPVAHYWFLESLFLIFVLVAFMERWNWLRSKSAFIPAWLAFAALFCIDPLPIYFGMQGAVYLLPFVLTGIASRRFAEELPDGRIIWIAAALFCALALDAASRNAGLPERNSAVALGLGVSGCVLLLRTRIQAEWLARLGRYSFSIFLFHSVFSAASRILLSRLSDFATWQLLIAGTLSGLALPIVVELAIRRSGSPLAAAMIGEKAPRRTPAVPRTAPTSVMPL
jgi:fucose 4-O-acetylase-like acetyltransferase